MCIVITRFLDSVQPYIAVCDKVAWGVSEVDGDPPEAPKFGHLTHMYGADMHSLFGSRRVRWSYCEHGIRNRPVAK
jgi:hypothetical protein